MNPEELLQIGSKLTENSFQKRKQTGEHFNIFYILNREHDEAHAHCLFLYEMLNPQGSHYQGDTFLRLFFKKVLKEPYTEDFVSVKREYAFDSQSRLDILISSPDFCYPIEVKIYAGEQDNQIERYCNWAKSVSNKPIVYFLTLDGKDTITVSNKNRKYVKLISFRQEITDWLLACMEQVESCVALRECIRQYYNVIERLTTDMDKQDRLELQSIISSSSENVKSAMLISEALASAKASLVKNIFSSIEEHISTKLEKIDTSYIYKADNNKSYPSLAYKLYEKDDCCLALRFELAWRLFFGVAYYRKDNEGKWEQVKLNDINFTEDEFRKFRFGTKDSSATWFDCWSFLTFNSQKIDFRSQNDTYFSLYDGDNLEKANLDFFEQIDSVLSNLGI